MRTKLSLTNLFILISTFVTLIVYFIFPELYQFGLNDYFLNQNKIPEFLIQIILHNFIHGDLFHLAGNMLILMIFGNSLEYTLGRTKYLYLFLFALIFNSIGILIFGNGTVVGISGFLLSILAFYTIGLKEAGNIEYKGGITAIFLSVAVGLLPGISLLGHLFGAIAGVIFYYGDKYYYLYKTKKD